MEICKQILFPLLLIYYNVSIPRHLIEPNCFLLVKVGFNILFIVSNNLIYMEPETKDTLRERLIAPIIASLTPVLRTQFIPQILSALYCYKTRIPIAIAGFQNKSTILHMISKTNSKYAFSKGKIYKYSIIRNVSSFAIPLVIVVVAFYCSNCLKYKFHL